ncbi:digalactosyldiacylglycerol synthase 2, chloroplastic-like [Telopea speciosissima]|uniref:digalactosyldiacylglycerol synthase 2, chloroplastic-like n=1 Tax=Telopea speciosissima TaxID=54955 RepID=UPI001CC7709A|nr:digalactosyldiacylglycerol synthase 2, chloroplastic-like [Telopea speciosissima]XP_043692136.1 digalactosyldiacylglycerol synthase 2, chloroplastic-like [Telopea speciosissima]XP_043692137.1 digalactosyldiacylglycerol synthase 2, chloroplastic-like [Telopea speciosissima]
MDRKQHIAIFTTASLPWMTGTAVNPLFRAAYLTKDGERKVTLVIPWLSLKDQQLVYPNNITFRSPREHEAYVRQWVEERTGFIAGFNINFYPGKFSRDKRSILAVGDITEIIPDEEADIAVLEEPEHLTWYHHGRRWKTKFRLVIGVVHTNYLEYVKREKNGVEAFLLKQINSWVIHIYCHKVIRLSAATQDLPKSIICNIHGVNPKFLEVGKKKQVLLKNGNQAFTKGAYYIGKMVWNKGYRELLKLLSDHQKELKGLQVDLFGNGEDHDQVEEAAKKLELAVKVHPGCDHADPLFHDFKVFLNPSTTDVVCTTTAEALAMGKIVICANHPSNDFFKQFPNCHTYNDAEGFVQVTCKALTEEPVPLTDEHRHELSWEAATERFLKVAELNQAFPCKPEETPTKNFMAISLNLKRNFEDASAFVHYAASGVEAARRAFGAIPGSLQPDEEQCKELGLSVPKGKHGSKWASRH